MENGSAAVIATRRFVRLQQSPIVSRTRIVFESRRRTYDDHADSPQPCFTITTRVFKTTITTETFRKSLSLGRYDNRFNRNPAVVLDSDRKSRRILPIDWLLISMYYIVSQCWSLLSTCRHVYENHSSNLSKLKIVRYDDVHLLRCLVNTPLIWDNHYYSTRSKRRDR